MSPQAGIFRIKQQKQVTPGTVRSTGVHKLSSVDLHCLVETRSIAILLILIRLHLAFSLASPAPSRGSPTNRVTRPPPKNPDSCPGLFCLASPQQTGEGNGESLESRTELGQEILGMVGRAPRFVTQFALSAELFFTSHLTCLCCRPSPGFDSLETSPSPNPWGGETLSLFPLGRHDPGLATCLEMPARPPTKRPDLGRSHGFLDRDHMAWVFGLN